MMKDLLIAIVGFSAGTLGLTGVGALLQVSEKLQSGFVRLGTTINLILVVVLGFFFVQAGGSGVQSSGLSFFQSGDYEFDIALYLDLISYVFLLVSAIFISIIVYFSSHYMHLELGHNRFFLIISLFILGLNLAILGSDLDSLFTGWETVGISSYLLIAYYWERLKPIRNAERVYLVYRVCDLGLLSGAFFAHHVWRGAGLFSILEAGYVHGTTSLSIVHAVQSLSLLHQWLLGGLVIVAALGKSAQFPFLTWLPRALEGPTPSSAIFYGALSVHLGLYLLLRMEPVWSVVPGLSIVLGVLGVLSALLASHFGEMQTTVKGQIAYASSAQVGVMFFELSLGLRWLALVHFVANAFYRGYQLLTAPSVVADRLQLQSYQEGLKPRLGLFSQVCWLNDSLYLFKLNEGYIDAIYNWGARRFTQLLSPLRAISVPIWKPNTGMRSIPVVVFVIILSVLVLRFVERFPVLHSIVSQCFLLGALLFAYLAYEERRNPLAILQFICISQVFPVIAMGLLNPHLTIDFWLCVYSIVLSFLGAMVALYRAFSRIGLQQQWITDQGLIHHDPSMGALFLISALCLVGFPLGFSQIAEDLVLHRLIPYGGLGAFAACATYVVNALNVVRLFGSVFLGPLDVLENQPKVTANTRKWINFILIVLMVFLQWAPFLIWRVL